MATDIEKVVIVLLSIGIIISAGNLYTMMELSKIPDSLIVIEDKLLSLESKLAERELFPGETELYSKAKGEGSLIIYTVWDIEDTVSLLSAFQKRYPGISTTYWQAKNREIQARVLQEYAAEQQSVDVICSSAAGRNLKPSGSLMPYITVQLDQLILQEPDNTVVNIAVGMVGWNTKVLEEFNLPPPKNWEDVTDPMYKGLVCLDDPYRGGGDYATLKDFWDDDTRWTNYVRGLKALEVPLYSSQSQEMRLVVAGEYAICNNLQSQDVISEQIKGAPIEYTLELDPVIISPRFASIYALPPHPNSAKLFVEWLLTVEAQLIFAEYYRTPNRKGVPSIVSLELLYPDTKNIITQPEEWIEDPAAWVDKYLKPVWEPPL